MPTFTDYTLNKSDSGWRWTDGKVIYRKVVKFGALPSSAGDLLVAHGITSIGQMVRMDLLIYNSESGVDWRTIPYESVIGDVDIGFNLDATNINIRVESDWSHFSGYAILEWTEAS
jgi:hypothetical protein